MPLPNNHKIRILSGEIKCVCIRSKTGQKKTLQCFSFLPIYKARTNNLVSYFGRKKKRFFTSHRAYNCVFYNKAQLLEQTKYTVKHVLCTFYWNIEIRSHKTGGR